jgi:hypothetical protein
MVGRIRDLRCVITHRLTSCLSRIVYLLSTYGEKFATEVSHNSTVPHLKKEPRIVEVALKALGNIAQIATLHRT